MNNPKSFKFNLKKKSKGRFAVRMRSYSIEDRKAFGKEHVNYVETTLPETEWARYGFNTSMSYEQTAHIKVHNASLKERDLKERKARFNYVEAEKKEKLLQSAYLPEAIVEAFEKKLKNDSFSADFDKSKIYYHWKTTLQIIKNNI